MNDPHALIQRFLQQQSVTTLPPIPEGEGACIKAGIVPFIQERIPPPAGGRVGGGQSCTAEQVSPHPNPPPVGEGSFLYYVMKPVARHPGLPPPEFQLCKGTRMHCPPQGWQDMREGDGWAWPCEKLIETALREGMEELGLVLPNIRRLFELGPYGFASATTRKPKQMWLFAAEVHSPDDFLPAQAVERATAERCWMSLSEFERLGRADHHRILHDCDGRITAL